MATSSCLHVASPETFAAPPKPKMKCYLVQIPEQLKVLFVPSPSWRGSVGQAVFLGEQRACMALGAMWMSPAATKRAVCLLKLALSQQQ